ncbi:glycosyl hydrolase 53 family protein [Cellulosilyticum ruminicola]|uniref:glycosyl hydrolase 53 family protein n=1 Tax=Cellulosilyticum ruminicola TaxID=425254 RepID=UPI001FA7EFD2|nr:glycosyl hydrolase 53 family protein [Cellulosilyticum ruminicola]
MISITVIQGQIQPIKRFQQHGDNNSLYKWMFDGLKNNGARYDVIGMSLYPSTSNWQTLANNTYSNMQNMVSRYGKEVMIYSST